MQKGSGSRCTGCTCGLLDRSLAGGLSGALSAEQLAQCAAAWRQDQEWSMQQPRSQLERSVLRCAQRLPSLTGCAGQQPTPDGAFVADVAATQAPSGCLVAIEADGPSHCLPPGRAVTGYTWARNRALEARGYVVVSVPYWRWDGAEGDPLREDALLAARVEAEVLRASGTAASTEDDEP